MATNWLMELLGSTGHLIIICEFCATETLYQKNLHLYTHLHTHFFFLESWWLNIYQHPTGKYEAVCKHLPCSGRGFILPIPTVTGLKG